MRSINLSYYDSDSGHYFERVEIISDKLNNEFIRKTLLNLVSDIEINKFKEEQKLNRLWNS